MSNPTYERIEFRRRIDADTVQQMQDLAVTAAISINETLRTFHPTLESDVVTPLPVPSHLLIATLKSADMRSPEAQVDIMSHILGADRRNKPMTVSVANFDDAPSNANPAFRGEAIRLVPTLLQRFDDRHLERRAREAVKRGRNESVLLIRRHDRAIPLITTLPDQKFPFDNEFDPDLLTLAGTHIRYTLGKVGLGPLEVAIEKVTFNQGQAA